MKMKEEIFKELETKEPWTPEQYNRYRIEKLTVASRSASSNGATSACLHFGVISISVILWCIFIAIAISRIK